MRFGHPLTPDDQKRLRNAGLRTFSLCGMGAVGETQTALEFADSHKGDFDAVSWVQVDENFELDESFSNVPSELRLLKASDATDRVVSRNAVLEWLQFPTKDKPEKLDDSGILPSLKIGFWSLITLKT